jgi:hypothetical protein
MIGFVRQFGRPNEVDTPYPVPKALLSRFRQIMLTRVSDVDHDELSNFQKEFDSIVAKWDRLGRTNWGSAFGIPNDNDMITASGSYIPNKLLGLVWPTPNSLRNVDAQCEMEITQEYVKQYAENDKEGPDA